MGIVVNPADAGNNPCTCFNFEKGERIEPKNVRCFVKGIKGALNDNQEREYCLNPEKRLKSKWKTPSHRMQRIWDVFKEVIEDKQREEQTKLSRYIGV